VPELQLKEEGFVSACIICRGPTAPDGARAGLYCSHCELTFVTPEPRWVSKGAVGATFAWEALQEQLDLLG